jgi:hypothetical protein
MIDANQRLHELRRKAETINATLIDDMTPFFSNSNLVFRRLPDSDKKGNVTTTCSCLMAMATSDQLIDFFKKVLSTDNKDKIQKRITAVFEHAVKVQWTSSGLLDNNAFSSLIVLRTAGLLSKSDVVVSTKPVLKMKHGNRSLRSIAMGFAKGSPDSFKVGGYPSKSALAYWFVDAIENLNLKIEEDRWREIVLWVSQVFARQLSLATSDHAAMKDPVEMAIAACLATRLRRIAASSDLEKRDEMIFALPTSVEVEQAIIKAFESQEKSGIWPKYFPLFNYLSEGVGSNYFFSFELLEVIVHEFEGTSLLENDIVLSGIERSLAWCRSNRLTYQYEGNTYKGWNSGGQITTLSEGKPESWATAMVHMFLRKLRSALSMSIENLTLDKYGASQGSSVIKKDEEDWNKFIDSPVELPEEKITVKKLIQREILQNIKNLREEIPRGKRMKHRRSALLFGPPGTSKTSLVRAIAKKIGWPLVELNPSDFLKEGLENIYAQADNIFNGLKDLSRTVVFFDEMDAVAQQREKGIDVTRQFLTTSMLPKLSMLHDEARVLFFMATNHQGSFDEAIKRPGRFDLLICMAPSLWKVKINNLEKYMIYDADKENVKKIRETLIEWIPVGDDLAKVLDLFTFGELKSFLEHIIKNKKNLSTAIADMDKAELREKVQDWGNKYIALREQNLEEFQQDQKASRLQ